MRPSAIAALACLAAAISAAGCYDSSFGESGGFSRPESATTTLAELRRLYAGETFRVDADVVVEGRVTTRDDAENFYRTFCIEQDGAGLEIMAGIDHLHNDYPEGCRVTVRLRGLALGRSRGVLQAGRMPDPDSGFATDYLGSKAALDAAVARHDGEAAPMEPARHTVATLSRELCGTLVRIDDLHYYPEDLSSGTWAGYKRFADTDGAEIYVYVRDYASFADDPVPAGCCSLTGILQADDRNGGRYILKLRDETDCVLH